MGYFEEKKTLNIEQFGTHLKGKKTLQRVQVDDLMLWHRKSRTYAHKHADQRAPTEKPSDYYTP